MLIGGLCHQLISSSVVGVGSLIDGSQNAVSPLAFRTIMKIAVKRVFLRKKCES